MLVLAHNIISSLMQSGKRTENEIRLYVFTKPLRHVHNIFAIILQELMKEILEPCTIFVFVFFSFMNDDI